MEVNCREAAIKYLSIMFVTLDYLLRDAAKRASNTESTTVVVMVHPLWGYVTADSHAITCWLELIAAAAVTAGCI